MKTAKENFLEKSPQQKRHPIRQKLLSALLCVCLLLASLPMETYGLEVQAEGFQKKILSFSDLPEEVKRQTVETGTPQENLNLPETLTVVCVPVENETSVSDAGLSLTDSFSKGTEPGSEGALPEEQQENSEDTLPGENPEGAVSGENPEDPEGAVSEENPENPEGAVSGENPENPEGEVSEENPENPEGALPENASGGADADPEGAEAPPEEQPEVPVPDSEPEQEPKVSSDTNSEETVIIEDVAWTGTPQYDSETEGAYVFTPVLTETYVLAEGAELPEIQVTVEENDNSQENGQELAGKKNRNKEEAQEEPEELRGGLPEMFSLAMPQCGVISEDATWEGSGTLENGELVVEPGVTLTIMGILRIKGNVTIRGGGTIKRGSKAARFQVNEGDYLTAENITMEGASINSPYSMIEVIKGGITLGDGCRIQNCTKTQDNPVVDAIRDGKIVQGGGGGAVLFMQFATGVFYNPVLENNCCTYGYGGVVFFRNSELTIHGGTYQNNKDASRIYAASCLYNTISKLSIYGGRFLHNTSTGKGGCIMNTMHNETETHLYGGYFEGNTCSYPGLTGSGGVYHLAYDPVSPNSSTGSILDLSGNVQFCGNGVEGSGVDGVYLDMSTNNNVSRKVQISNTLSYPVTLYLKQASEGYVIAEGTNEYILLHERDMKKINFVDTSNSGKKWYAVLDKENNQVYLSTQNPQYGYYVYYISNGAKGTVVDDGRYEIGAIAKVQSDAPLEWENHTFLGWDTKADGSGERYLPGDDLKIEGDTNLYAIFSEGKKKTFQANFYSGGECRKETRSIMLDEPENQGTMEALEAEKWEGWDFIGWERENISGYTGKAQPGQEVVLTEEKTNFYGVYRKNVTLSYVAEGAGQVPESEALPCYANVHETIGVQEPEFTIAQGPEREGYAFVGWNTDPDGNGDAYPEGSVEKFAEDVTLYAMYSQKKVFAADFWSGSAGTKERASREVEEGVLSADISAPELKEMEGWEPVGWDTGTDSYEGNIRPGASLTLKEPLQEYYGIYKKGVTLAYDANGGGEAPEAELRFRYANVHEDVTYRDPEIILAAAPVRAGYAFKGWSGAQDGTGTLYAAGSAQKINQDATLYAVWEEDPDVVNYQVEHYCQDLVGDGYTRVDGDTETLTGVKGEEVTARPKKYTGFTVNLSHPSGKASGIVEGDGSLALKFYYNRNIYEVDFNLNGGYGTVPETQKIRYGGLLEKVADPAKAGYNFKGWHMDDEGLDGGLWDFESPVENNTGKLHTTLYAKWADELAPAMGEAAFSSGYRNFRDWLIQKESMAVTVPVTEEGSGLARAEYLLASEDGTEKKGTAQIKEIHALSSSALAYGAGASIIRAAQDEIEHGSYEAQIFIEEEFKGKVYLTCTDHAGNISAQKTLAAEGGGVIVEDNAPEIHFSNTKEITEGKPLEVEVQVKDNMDGHVTGGISSISYQLDEGKKKSLPEEEFSGDFVEEYGFTVKVKGSGKHTLRVEAEDHGGNQSAAEVTLRIHSKKDVPAKVPHEPTEPDRPGRPLGGEPKTGEGSHVKIYATIAMIAGFSYLLLYFEGENGITEQEKEEILSRLVYWAKRGGRIRRFFGLALIFLFLAYYHSIGKSVNVEWKEVYVKK